MIGGSNDAAKAEPTYVPLSALNNSSEALLCINQLGVATIFWNTSGG